MAQLRAGIAAGACGAAGLMAWAVRGRSSSVFGPSVCRGPRSRAAIALTFDDGPSESTPALLKILARHNVRATFFQCGANVERLPDIAREVRVAGHEIGNHGHTHAPFYLRSPAFVEAEVGRAQEAIAAATGAVPRLLRAPFGARWFGMERAQRRYGLLGVMWTAIGRDWALPADAVTARLAACASNGAILCLHDGRELQPHPDIGPALASVDRLISILHARGFKLETVSQLICLKT